MLDNGVPGEYSSFHGEQSVENQFDGPYLGAGHAKKKKKVFLSLSLTSSL